MIKLTLPLPPSANRYWRRAGNRIYVSQEAQDYKAHVGWLCNQQGIEPLSGDVWVALKVYRKQKRGDLDNTLKVTLDSLNGYAYTDDSQIVHIGAHRYDDKVNPRIEVTIYFGETGEDAS